MFFLLLLEILFYVLDQNVFIRMHCAFTRKQFFPALTFKGSYVLLLEAKMKIQAFIYNTLGFFAGET